MTQSFEDWFKQVTGNRPYPYQKRLADAEEWPIVIDVPTGLGKTAAVILAWLWQRSCSNDQESRRKTPRRLVYILPMRTLVEQIHGEIEKWLKAAGKDEAIAVYKLMGGAVSKDWDRDPSQDCIIVGTQDQILSRCLNRGYSMSKFKWPIHFGLLNQDCLFVIDETQLMGAGLRTTAQLQGLRNLWHTYGSTHTVWMSATLDADLLTTADYQPDLDTPGARLELNDRDKEQPAVKQRLESQKQLQKFPIACPAKEKDEDKYLDALAQQIDAIYKSQPSPGLVLVICNRVRRAQKLYSKLVGKAEDILLIHSRFRAGDRKTLNKKLLDNKDLTGIVIATQAIEAGIDISAQYLFTELSPWSSFVQRVGRCNRKGEDNDRATVYWIDFEDLSEDSVRPYEMEELEQTRKFLDQLEEVGPAKLRDFWDAIPPAQRPQPKIEGLIPRQHDLMQLFDTSTDLAGHDLDISCFIRDAENMDVAIAWRNWDGEAPPNDSPALQPDELCQVGIGAAKAFLKDPKKVKGYVFDRLQGSWEQVDWRAIYPGQTILVNCESGGYLESIGFTGNPNPKGQKTFPSNYHEIANETDESDNRSYTKEFISLKQHSDDIVKKLEEFLGKLQADSKHFENPPISQLIRAARWHDAGKAHKEFQEMLHYKAPEDQKDVILAKSARTREERKADSYHYPPDRRGFRHELASALWALQHEEDFLIPYLVACHHGKVRMTIQSRPTEQAPSDRATDKSENENDLPKIIPNVAGPIRYALGVHEGDILPSIDLGDDLQLDATQISLACMELGGTLEVQVDVNGKVVMVGERSWTERSVELLEEYGPFRLAFLEALIRIADWKASEGNGITLED